MNRFLSRLVLAVMQARASRANWIRYYRFMHTLQDSIVTLNCGALPLSERDQIDLVSVAFDNVPVVAHQIRLIQKYLQDPHVFTVGDNSSDPQKRDALLALCEQHKVCYLRLPPNPYTGVDASVSHGAALNWLYHQYIRKRSARYFGFIDHDVFPIRPTRLIPEISVRGVYGHIQERGNRWYLWAGFCFFGRDAVRDVDLDFLPCEGLDTGGGNWSRLYCRLNRVNLSSPSYECAKLREGSCRQADIYEMIGDWVHTLNASSWMAVPDKDDLVGALLSRF